MWPGGLCGQAAYPFLGVLQEKKMETSHYQCQDLKAKYEKASSETKTKHEEILQNFQKMLVDTEDKLKAAQEANRDLMQDMEELKSQADKAKVGSGQNVLLLYLSSVLYQGCRRAEGQMGPGHACRSGRLLLWQLLVFRNSCWPCRGG